PEESVLWATLATEHDNPGFTNAHVNVSDRARSELSKWPWNFDSNVRQLQTLIEAGSNDRLGDFLPENIGYGCVTRADDIYFLPRHVLRRVSPAGRYIQPLTVGDEVRNW